MPRNTPTLTLEEAEAILAGAKAKVLEMGVNMSISVVDPRGDLITMMRTDGASWRTPPISRAKARGGVLLRTGQRRADRERPRSGVPRPDGDGRRAHDPRPGRSARIPGRRARGSRRRQRRHRPGRRRRLPRRNRRRWLLRHAVRSKARFCQQRRGAQPCAPILYDSKMAYSQWAREG